MKRVSYGKRPDMGTDAEFLWFSDEREEAKAADPGVISLGITQSDTDLEKAWRRVRAKVLLAWKRKYPGTRPSTWWRFDAPRAKPGTFLSACGHDLDPECTLPEPLRKLSGMGRPAWEVISLAPNLEYGLPLDWTVAENSEIAVRDWLLGGTVEDTDPPTFESQAAYLKRHNLLTAEEANRADFTPAIMEGEEPCGPDCRCGRHGKVIGTGRCGSKW